MKDKETMLINLRQEYIEEAEAVCRFFDVSFSKITATTEKCGVFNTSDCVKGYLHYQWWGSDGVYEKYIELPSIRLGFNIRKLLAERILKMVKDKKDS
jgi:hypothetical protein